MTLSQVTETMSVMAGPIALEAPAGGGGAEGDGEAATFGHFLEDKAESIEKMLVDEDFRDKLLSVISTLSPREQKIVRCKLSL